MGERPWWDWTRHVPSDVVSLLANAGSTMPSVLEDLVPNVVRNPFGVAKVGRLARAADLHAEFDQLRNRGLPVSVIHSNDDGVIPRSSFENICVALGVEGVELAGNHSWPLTQPDDFAGVISAFARTSRVMKQLARPSTRR
jgi:pimeloyl-ACP methyl ester carboxylesterase